MGSSAEDPQGWKWPVRSRRSPKEVLARNTALSIKMEVRIFLIEAGPNILNGYPEPLGKKAQKMLKDLGVRLLLNTPVTKIEQHRITFSNGTIDSPNII